MATPTYDLLDSTTLASSASSYTLSSISQDYRDLVLVVEASGTATPAVPYCRFNSDSGTNYSYVQMFGDGSTPQSYSGSLSQIRLLNTNLSDSSFSVLQIMDYSATDKHKSVLVRSNRASYGTTANAIRWASTSPITSIEVYANSNAFATGSTFHLYGIAS